MLWKRHIDRPKLQEQNHLSEPKGCLPSDGEVDTDPDISLSLEEYSPTPILAPLRRYPLCAQHPPD